MESEKVKEIKKALACCNGGCNEACPYYHNSGCINDLLLDTITLINELERANERLKDSNKNILFVNEHVIKQNDDLTKENERLKNRIATLEYKLDAKESYYNAVKDRALEVFANKVKMEFYYEFDEIIPSIMADKIDKILKECLGK